MMSRTKGKRVFVAMSGGVDSSVAAALLQKEGFDVTGVFMKAWNPPWLSCSWPEERRDAMRVAIKLGIPFLTFDFSREYKRGVIDYMIAEYKAGRTPNPDVMCNKEIKFGLFLKKALEMGADFVATGHYVRKEAGTDFENLPQPSGQVSRLGGTSEARISEPPRWGGEAGLKNPCRLLQAKDPVKDQSYFLWTLTQEQLKRCLFRIGEYTKPEVRRLAKKFGLSTAEKKDSQGLCFLGKVDLKDFLKRYIKPRKGAVLDEKGEVIGEHEGVEFYTIGERHGFRVLKKSPKDKPLYVVGKDLGKNTLIVSETPRFAGEQAKYRFQMPNEVQISNINWILGKAPKPGKYLARVRYRQPLEVCKVYQVNKVYKVIFDQPQIAAAGQSLVIYTEYAELFGGGVIV